MKTIPSAGRSPDVVNGVLRWYAGDTFSFHLKFEIMDEAGLEVRLAATDTVTITFFDFRLNIVKQFSFSEIQNNTVTLDFDEECSALFEPGKYTYDITLGAKTTIAKDNPAVVM